jgi:hypothetical protein
MICEFPFGHQAWFNQYHRQYEVYMAEAIRNGWKFSMIWIRE